MDLLTGGDACEVWKNRDYVSTFRFAAHRPREVNVAGSETLCAGLGMHLAGSATAGTATIPPRDYIR